jgi:hypothetical protein
MEEVFSTSGASIIKNTYEKINSTPNTHAHTKVIQEGSQI